MSHSQTCPTKNWRLFKNVYRATNAFSNSLPRQIDLSDLIQDLKNYTQESLVKSPSSTDLAIQKYRTHCRLFECIQRSTKSDLQEISLILQNRPDRYIRQQKDPESFVNKPNCFGIRPLYQAAKHGHCQTVQLLIQFGAQLNLKCNGENCLEVSSRWGHTEVVKCLLENYEWTAKEKRRARRVASNSVKDLLKVRNRFLGCG